MSFSNRTNGNYGYWTDSSGKLLSKYGTSYPANVFDSNSNLYEPVQNYKTYLKNTLGKTSVDARLITFEVLIGLGCDKNEGTCKYAPSWIYNTSYWTASAKDDDLVLFVTSSGIFSLTPFNHSWENGLRPVITISKSAIS